MDAKAYGKLVEKSSLLLVVALNYMMTPPEPGWELIIRATTCVTLFF